VAHFFCSILYISSKGVGDLVFIDKIMDRFLYVNILANNLDTSAAKIGLDRYIFQHDNDPKHSSALVKKFLEEKKINVLKLPSQSPDLNPIKHIWAYMKRELRGKMFKNKDELKKTLLDLWNDISVDFVRKLMILMPRRIRAVLLAKEDTLCIIITSVRLFCGIN
jgi:hypothetical protein